MIEIERGNTVRFEVEFYDFENNLVNPETVIFKVYDFKYNELSSNPLTDENKVNSEVGKYFVDTVFEKLGNYYIEFLAMVGDNPSLERKKVAVVFDS